MNVISKRTLIKFYEQHIQAKSALEVWHSDVRKSIWSSPADIKELYSSASFLSDNRVVFNIKGNDYRLIVHIDYSRKIVRVKFIGTHAEYDKINAKEI
jgi:mRNA interferase HigB